MPPADETGLRRRLGALVRAGQLTEAEAEEHIRRLMRASRAPAPPPKRSGGIDRGQRPDVKDKLSAPYRFVTLDDRIARPAKGDAVLYDVPLADGYCATIDVEWAAETPLLIGQQLGGAAADSETVGPLKVGGAYVVPGASLRGMIRAAVEIVAFARLRRVNFHHRYGLRDFLHPGYADAEGGGFPLADHREVKAGWLRKERLDSVKGGDALSDYVIEPCSWKRIEIATFLDDRSMALPRGMDRQRWVATELERKYRYAGMVRGDGPAWTGTRRFRQLPDPDGRPCVIVDPSGEIEGDFVFSGRAPGTNSRKRFEYVFHGARGQRIRLTRDQWETFRRLHSKPSRHGLEADGSWAILQPIVEREGGSIPVFYVGEPGKPAAGELRDTFAMGLTRLFKVPHRNSVGDIVGRQRNHRQQVEASGTSDSPWLDSDFVETLFGHVYEGQDIHWTGEGDPPASIARRGRIAFSFGRFLEPGWIAETDTVGTVMMGPRASFAPFYLRGDVKDYADEAARVAGRKRYLPRFVRGGQTAREAILSRLKGQLDNAPQSVRDNSRIQTRLRFLRHAQDGDLRFASTIRLHNVRAEELGAVLCALTHDGDADKRHRHMLGRAKAFGAGQIRVVGARLAVEPNDSASASAARVRPPDAEELPGGGREGLCPLPKDGAPTGCSHRPFLQAFDTFMRGAVGENWRQSSQIGEFLGLAWPAIGGRLAAQGRLEYLSDVQDFARVRRMAQSMKDGSPPRYPREWGGRYLESPPDES